MKTQILKVIKQYDDYQLEMTAKLERLGQNDGANLYLDFDQVEQLRKYPLVEDVREHFADHPLMKWNGITTAGPLHYLANTCYLASNRDYNGLLDGEFKQSVSNKGRPMWKLLAFPKPGVEVPEKLVKYIHKGHERPGLLLAHIADLVAGDKPTLDYDIEWVPCLTVGKGKKRELAAARHCAYWPDATDEELTAPGLAQRLLNRLPALMWEFNACMIAHGFDMVTDLVPDYNKLGIEAQRLDAKYG